MTSSRLEMLEEAARQRRLNEALQALSVSELGALTLNSPEGSALRSVLQSMPPESVRVAWMFPDGLEQNGLLAITVRPEEYWSQHDQAQSAVDVDTIRESHRPRGLAFQPHLGPSIEGEVRYGDTSMSLDYMLAA